MKQRVVIDPEDVPTGAVHLMRAIEPADLAALEAAVEHLSAFRDVTRRVFRVESAPVVIDLSPWQRELGKAIVDQGQLLEAVADQLSKVSAAQESQREFALALADRVCKQSELLIRRAEAPQPTPEKPAEETPLGPQEYVPHCERCPAFLTCHESRASGLCAGCRSSGPTHRIEAQAVRVIDDSEADLAPPAPYPSVPATAEAIAVEPEPAPQAATAEPPSPAPCGRGIHCADAAGKTERSRANRTAVLRVLATGPLRFAEIVVRTGIPRGSMTDVLNNGTSGGVWERVKPLESTSPYHLTDKGRKALADDGYVVPVETKAAVPETIAPKVEAPAPVAETIAPIDRDGPRARARAHAKLIAEAIRDAGEPINSHEISNRAGLPLDLVQRRLQGCSYPRSSDPGMRYFSSCNVGTWKLTNAGHDLAAEGESC